MAERNYQEEHHQEQLRREAELESIQKFHEFLQGTIPAGVTVRKIKKMNAKQAMTVVWFLQEICHILPDMYEMCDNCHEIYDSYGGGERNEKTGKFTCGECLL
jgi:hypothetical protein